LGASDIISAFINKMLEENDGLLELQRNELAQRFKVVPSQINYVISSRFTPEQGYIIESRRGGGGYIRIQRVQYDKSAYLMHIINTVGTSINAFETQMYLKNMLDNNFLTSEAVKLMSAGLSDVVFMPLNSEVRDVLRANIFKNMLISCIIK